MTFHLLCGIHQNFPLYGGKDNERLVMRLPLFGKGFRQRPPSPFFGTAPSPPEINVDQGIHNSPAVADHMNKLRALKDLRQKTGPRPARDLQKKPRAAFRDQVLHRIQNVSFHFNCHIGSPQIPAGCAEPGTTVIPEPVSLVCRKFLF